MTSYSILFPHVSVLLGCVVYALGKVREPAWRRHPSAQEPERVQEPGELVTDAVGLEGWRKSGFVCVASGKWQLAKILSSPLDFQGGWFNPSLNLDLAYHLTSLSPFLDRFLFVFFSPCSLVASFSHFLCHTPVLHGRLAAAFPMLEKGSFTDPTWIEWRKNKVRSAL